MKALTKIALLSALAIAVSGTAFGAQKKTAKRSATIATTKTTSLAKDLDSLGGNEALIGMADSLNPEIKSRIVQERIVERRNRLEVGINYGGVAGGTTYLQSQSLGFNLDFHITPRWALGLRYSDFNSRLTPEGARVFEEARSNNGLNASGGYVDIDTPLNSTMGVLNWFPMYGKINAFEAAVIQFDLYLLLGGGQMNLESGPASIITAGGGVGVWLTQHLTARAEVRYQGYQDLIKTGPRDIDSVVGTLGLGWIL